MYLNTLSHNMLKNTKIQQPTTEPQKPKPDVCCGGGSCCPCVWDTYRAQRKEWLKVNEKLNKT